jgi:GNAT superfamily N-acetyltransferase
METRTKAFWGEFFGVEPDELDRPGVRVVPHQGLGDYPGAWIFWRGGTVFLSTPASLAEPIRKAIPAIGSHRPPIEWAELFHDRTERQIGPAYQGFLDPARFRPAPGGTEGRLVASGSLLERLQAECDPEEWSHAGLDPARPEPCFGFSVAGRIVAAAQNSFWAVDAVSPGLIVHPEHRGRGFGKAVLSAAVRHALEHQHLVLYQTLLSNAPAIRAAASLGFTPFATHLALRFRSEPPV